MARLGQLALTELGEADLISLACTSISWPTAPRADGAAALERLADGSLVEKAPRPSCTSSHGGMGRVSTPVIGLNGSAYGNPRRAPPRRRRTPARRDLHFLNSVANVLRQARSSRRHFAEAELRRTPRAFFSAIIEGTPDAVFVEKDLEGRYLVINDAGASHTNRTRSELIGATAYDVFPADEAMEITDADRARVVAAGSPRSFEEVRRQDGRTHRLARPQRPRVRRCRAGRGPVRHRARHHRPQGARGGARAQRGAAPARPGEQRADGHVERPTCVKSGKGDQRGRTDCARPCMAWSRAPRPAWSGSSASSTRTTATTSGARSRRRSRARRTTRSSSASSTPTASAAGC